MKTTIPGSIGGMNVAIACPNMWLSGRRLRNRSGKNGRPHFRYLATSRSIGTMFASTFRCVTMTPFGSAVAPEVKMISATSSRLAATGEARRVSRHSNSDIRQASAPSITPGASSDATAGTSSPTRTRRAVTTPRTRSTNSSDER